MRHAAAAALLCLTDVSVGSSENLECPPAAASQHPAPAELDAREARRAEIFGSLADLALQEDDDIHLIQVRAPATGRPTVARGARSAGAVPGVAAARAASPQPPAVEEAAGAGPVSGREAVNLMQVGAVRSENRSASINADAEDGGPGNSAAQGARGTIVQRYVGEVHEAGNAGSFPSEADEAPVPEASNMFAAPLDEDVPSAAAAGEVVPESNSQASISELAEKESRDGSVMEEYPVTAELAEVVAEAAEEADTLPSAAAGASIAASRPSGVQVAETSTADPSAINLVQSADAQHAAEALSLMTDARLTAGQGEVHATNKALTWFVVLMMIATGVLLRLLRSSRSSTTAARRKVELIRETTGAEIRSMFGFRGLEYGQAISPGILTRIQGKVAAKPGAMLTAPFSGKPCVSYSASVSSQRTNGVHQPPIAFYTTGVDFEVQLEDGSQVSLSVHSHEASLFDMVRGKSAEARAFADAPESWRGFTMAHITATASSGGAAAGGVVSQLADLGAKGAALEFCECALLVGSRVTCVGEVVCKHDGTLSLCPWRPPPMALTQRLGDTGQSRLSKAVPWLAPSWEKGPTRKSIVPQPDPLAGHVLISDDEVLADQGVM